MFSRAFLFLEILPRKIFKGLYETQEIDVYKRQDMETVPEKSGA